MRLTLLLLISTVPFISCVDAIGRGLCTSAPTILAAVDSAYLAYMHEVSAAYVLNRTQTVDADYVVSFTIDQPGSIYGIDVINNPNASYTFVLTQFFSLDSNGAGRGIPTRTNASIFPFTGVALGVIYNLPEVQTRINLSVDVLALIAFGNITLWNDSRIQELNPSVSLPNRAIKTVARSDASADTAKYTEVLAQNFHWRQVYGAHGFDSPLIGNTTTSYWPTRDPIDFFAKGLTGMFGIVESIPHTLGYASLGSITAYGAVYSALKNSLGEMTLPTVGAIQPLMSNINISQPATSTAKTLQVVHLLHPLIKSAYPAAFIYYLMFQEARLFSDCCLAQEFIGFIDFALNSLDADLYVIQNSLIPLTAELKALVADLFLKNARCQSGAVNVYDAYVKTVERQGTPLPNYTTTFWPLGVAFVVLLLVVAAALAGLWRRRQLIEEKKQWMLRSSTVKLFADEENVDSSAPISNVQHPKFSMWLAVRLEGGEKALAQACFYTVSLHGEKIAAAGKAYRLNSRLSPNVARFVGIWHTKHPDQLFILHEHCAKGTLHEVLQMSRYRFDQNPSIKYSMAIDIAEGMLFLHQKGITHGLLNSLNCLLDSNWQVKVAGWVEFQLTSVELAAHLLDLRTSIRHASLHRMIRHLYLDDVAPFTPAGDVFSYGLILFKIFERRIPFIEHFSANSLRTNGKAVDLERMKEFLHARGAKDAVRPQLMLSDAIPPDITALIDVCISERVQDRPTFAGISQAISEMRPNKQGVVDAMMDTVEAYMDTLEKRVEERTAELHAMTVRMEELIMEVLPPKIGRSLLAGERVVPEAYDCATIFFSDLVDFTELSSMSTPMEVIDMLNCLWTAFDSVVQRFDAYKIETIGDAYMACSGIPERNENRHVREIARVALELRDLVSRFEIPHRPHERLRIRAGISSGPVTAGVIGFKMPHYTVFGDTVNAASRMESTSEPMKIQVTAETAELLRADFASEFLLTRRGEIEIKGKGTMTTYWLDRP